MGTLFRAATGFVIALTLLHGAGLWSELKPPSIHKVQADIEAEHPGAQLKASLNEFLAPQKGTIARPNPAELRARGLQF